MQPIDDIARDLQADDPVTRWHALEALDRELALLHGEIARQMAHLDARMGRDGLLVEGPDGHVCSLADERARLERMLPDVELAMLDVARSLLDHASPAAVESEEPIDVRRQKKKAPRRW